LTFKKLFFEKVWGTTVKKIPPAKESNNWIIPHGINGAFFLVVPNTYIYHCAKCLLDAIFFRVKTYYALTILEDLRYTVSAILRRGILGYCSEHCINIKKLTVLLT